LRRILKDQRRSSGISWSIRHRTSGVRRESERITTQQDFATQNARNSSTIAKFKTILRDLRGRERRSEVRIQKLEELNRKSGRNLEYVTEQLHRVVACDRAIEQRLADMEQLK